MNLAGANTASQGQNLAVSARSPRAFTKGRIAIWATLSGIGLALPALADAQGIPAASRVAPETLAPIQPQADGSILLPEQAAEQAPAGSDNLRIKASRLSVEVGSQAPEAVLQAIADARGQIDNHSVSVSELYAAAARIEATYARTGHVLARVTLPPQHLTDGGPVRFLVVDGFIESIDVSQLPGQVRDVVRRRVATLIGRKNLTLAEIERRVLLAGDVPGVQLHSALVRGSAIGATRLVLSGQYRLLSGGMSVENNLGSFYRYEAFSTQLALNSALGLGEQIYVQATSGPDLGKLFSADTTRRLLGAGAIVPIGHDGLTLNPEFTRVDTNPRAGQGSPQITGQFERMTLRVNYPLIRNRHENFAVTGGFTAIRENEQAKAFSLILSEDRLRIVNLGLNFARSVARTMVISADGDVSVGLAGLGARSQADATASGIALSRQFSRPDFRKATAHMRIDDQLGHGVNLSAITHAQASFTAALPASAQFSLDGAESLSSFTQGSINADSGITERLEIARPFAPNALPHSLLTPYAFAALGYGHLYHPTTAGEFADVHSWSTGAGLRLMLSPAHLGLTSSATLEVSHGHATTQASDPTRVTASVNFRF